ncbi:MAG: DNA polymerase III subunit epsilon [Oceanospirillaceae bacterium]|jgi:DNA polymerase-3 subunit epsilon|nr:DNA polymerase III subunit epsilon [Oceanospirillaceae bacterium]MBT4442311.1 DNA polymerase III subunit epsilon [Oceanospirillaceae bacterium]MBT6076364.1 DNA polymerase III subunit epsilon [Oceanospirillaceae bacterium]
MRIIVLDTETTGLEPKQGHRLIEVGALEMVNRRLTGKSFHEYVQPERDVPLEAQAVHGISEEFLQDKPLFAAIADDFLDFIRGAELVIHNAPFDLGFLDNELAIVGKAAGRSYPKIADICKITDSLKLARQKHPGQKNNLDALCRRYGINNAHRELHGALLDSEILTDVYLMMTGGQTDLLLAGDTAVAGADTAAAHNRQVQADVHSLVVVKATDAELAAHDAKLAQVAKASGDQCMWLTTTD